MAIYFNYGKIVEMIRTILIQLIAQRQEEVVLVFGLMRTVQYVGLALNFFTNG